MPNCAVLKTVDRSQCHSSQTEEINAFVIQDDYIQDLMGVIWTRTRDFIKRRIRKGGFYVWVWGVPNRKLCAELLSLDFIDTTINYGRTDSCRTGPPQFTRLTEQGRLII